MPNRMTRLISVSSFLLTVVFFSQTAFSQTPGSRAALAAKQRLKTEVQDAMADGKISKLERAEILAGAKEVLTVKEFEGLKLTMDRLSPVEKKPTNVAKRSAKERAMMASIKDKNDSSMLGQMLSRVPYLDDFSMGPHPEVTKTASAIPYMKSSSLTDAGVKQATVKTTPKETYLEMPTADRPYPRILRVERTAATGRPASTESVEKNQVKKQASQKYADNSISPIPQESSSSRVEFASKSEDTRGESVDSADAPALAVPADALLPDRRASWVPTGYAKPTQPESVELEFAR